jgi:hypothetical protein
MFVEGLSLRRVPEVSAEILRPSLSDALRMTSFRTVPTVEFMNNPG